MIDISDKEFKKLLKDADDNKTIMRLFKYALIMIVFICFMFSYGCHHLDMIKQREIADNNVYVREIESEGMTYDEYIRWLEAKD